MTHVFFMLLLITHYTFESPFGEVRHVSLKNNKIPKNKYGFYQILAVLLSIYTAIA